MCTGVIHLGLLPALSCGEFCGFSRWEIARTRGTVNRVRAWLYGEDRAGEPGRGRRREGREEADGEK